MLPDRTLRTITDINTLLLAFACLYAATLPGCTPGDSKGPWDSATGNGSIPDDSPAVPVDTARYTLVGEVVRIDRDRGSVAIRHEDIPGFMPAMTMPFDLSGQEVLEELQVGDQVEGTLVVDRGSSKLTDLIITRPALSPPTVLDTTGPTPIVRPRREPLEVGQEVSDFTITTQEGERLALSELRGRIVALTFIYTRCPLPDFCPKMDRKFGRLSEMVRMLPDDAEQRIRLLSISFDPEHDTPEVLARHAATLGARPPRWTFAVAEHDELRKVAEPLGLQYGPTPNEVIHNLVTAIIDPNGRLLRLETGGDWSPEDLYRTLARSATGRGSDTTPDDPTREVP